MIKQKAVYIVANKKNGALYTGVTSHLIQRIFQHKNLSIDGFAKKYGCKILVYYELHENMLSAIEREKKIKIMKRSKKIGLIEFKNFNWEDLYPLINKW